MSAKYGDLLFALDAYKELFGAKAYRVIVGPGPVTSRSAAERALKKLKAAHTERIKMQRLRA